MELPCVYTSFAPDDEMWADRVRASLLCLGHQERLRCVDRRDVRTGDQEPDGLLSVIESADLSVILVSVGYLNFPPVKDVELPALLDRRRKSRTHLLPLLVRPCPWRTVQWLKDMQIFPAGGRALSGGDEHQIDLDLTDLAYRVNDLLP